MLITAKFMNCKLILHKRPNHKYRRGFEEDIKMDIKERGCNIVKWICLAQDILQYEGDADKSLA